MDLFQVYSRFDLEITQAKDVYVYDAEGSEYLDLYGGHGVISIGHQHPHYIKRLTEQLGKIGFYSNSVNLPIQHELARKLGKVSAYETHKLFLCSSGAEANENALKLASFHTGKSKVIAFHNGFHGRTAAALNVTDNPKLRAPLNVANFPVEFFDLNDRDGVLNALKKGDVCAVIVEGIQGVGGLDMPTPPYLHFLLETCHRFGALLILDEIQSGFGRSGKFFAHQHAGIEADIVTTAKGMGNGFPVAGLLIHPKVKALPGMLGTTFGGNPLACAATLAVLETLETNQLIEGVSEISQGLIEELNELPGIVRVKGLGLMLGVEFAYPIKELRHTLLHKHRIFTGASVNPNLLRVLPPLSIKSDQLSIFSSTLKELLHATLHLH